MTMNISPEKEYKLFEAWDWCDQEDKSTEFMLAFMADVADLEYTDVVEWIADYDTDRKREIWYEIQDEINRNEI